MLRLWEEYNDGGVLLWIEDFPGAFTRGKTEAEALAQVDGEAASYLRFAGGGEPDTAMRTIERRYCPRDLSAGFALFDSERTLADAERESLSRLVLRSAKAVRALSAGLPERARFDLAGESAPDRTELRAKDATGACLAALGVAGPSSGDLVADRLAALSRLDAVPPDRVTESDGELWTLKKAYRRILFSDRLCAKALYAAAAARYGTTRTPNPFFFRLRPAAALSLSPRVRSQRETALIERIPTTDEETLAFLIETVRRERPRRILEIGTAIGVSAAAMAECGAQVVTIEKDEALCSRARALFAECRLPVEGIAGDAACVLPTLRDPFDFIFLDGPKVQYIKYLPELKRLLRRGGLLVADDVSLYGWGHGGFVPPKRRMLVAHLKEYLDAVRGDPELKTEVLELGEGVAVSRKL